MSVKAAFSIKGNEIPLALACADFPCCFAHSLSVCLRRFSKTLMLQKHSHVPMGLPIIHHGNRQSQAVFSIKDLGVAPILQSMI